MQKYPRRLAREAREFFSVLPCDLARGAARDLIAYPVFSLAKSVRLTPIDIHLDGLGIRVETAGGHGIATIWDADILIWAARRILDARDAGWPASSVLTAAPADILTPIGRGTSARDCHRLTAALDRLQSTAVAVSLRGPSARRDHRFSWLSEWTGHADVHGHCQTIELILPAWLHGAVLDRAVILDGDAEYFGLRGGLERWLHRVLRAQSARAPDASSVEFANLHARCASQSPFQRFALELHDIVRRQPLPGYRLRIEPQPRGREFLVFEPAAAQTSDQTPAASQASGAAS
ncbi:MAG TPA: replication initiator protein A [Rhizomicrobium sp.]|jgi:plasmid replication initiation protein|nr:replication initiator protein A [Rhizomicrobium sp.]